MNLKGTLELPRSESLLTKLADKDTPLTFEVDGVIYEIISKKDYIVTDDCVIVNCNTTNNT